MTPVMSERATPMPRRPFSMQRRRILVATASAAVVAPFAGLAGCGNSSGDDEPQPVPPSDVVLQLPGDMYLHHGAPTEWWWHTGTLVAGNRTFGFEINAASFAKDGFAFTQIMLTDVAGGRHYQRTAPFVPPLMFDPSTWAQADPAKKWSAQLGSADNHLSAIALVDPGSGYTSNPTVEITGGGGSGGSALLLRNPDGTIKDVVVASGGSGYTSTPTVTIVGGGGSGAQAQAYHTYVTMEAPAGDPTQNIRVRALLNDELTGTEVEFDLLLSQQGRPFFVWGTGVIPDGTPGGGVTENNYYFSLTRLEASGTIAIDGEQHAVSGVTWMDHEYGAFGTAQNPVKWTLQDMQLDNGFCISNYATLEVSEMALGKKVDSQATLQDASGATWFVPTFMTPVGRTWTSPRSGETYFLEWQVEIPSFKASLLVSSLLDEQEFVVPTAPVYEGVAVASGTFRNQPVSGTAWIEEAR
jgi:predicted secreted hydrolase